MNGQTWRRGTIFFSIAALVLVLVGLLVGESVGTSKAAPPQSGNPDISKILTVRSASVDCAALVRKHGGTVEKINGKTLVKYDIGALKGTPPRKWSDAISTPMNGSSPAAQREDLQSNICQDPELGATAANMFANLRVSNVSVGSLNPWLAPFADAGQINDQAKSYVTLLDVDSPTSAQQAQAVKQNLAWQHVAAKVATLVGRFQVAGDESLKSAQNWHLTAGGLEVGTLPEVSLNSQQESLPALVLEVTEKGASCALTRVGFNLGDQRPEVFPTPNCAPPKKAPPKTVPSHPGPTHPPTHPPVTHQPSPTPTCTPAASVPNPAQGTECGKDDRYKPPYVSQHPVVTCPNGYLDRDTQTCVDHSYSPPPPSPEPSESPGQGDSGPGATNTTSPPPTSSPPASDPSPTSPTSNPPKP